MACLTFAGQSLELFSRGAVFWPARNALLVADLHLEKASYFARFGQLLPPYDSDAALSDIEMLITQTGASEIWCLGDSFHDEEGASRLPLATQRRLGSLMGRADWIWITGNHDKIVRPLFCSRVMNEACVNGIWLRHQAEGNHSEPEISGHWHPRLYVRIRGRRVVRPCFVLGPSRLILPSFGALTGGMNAADPAVLSAVGQPATALVATDDRLLRFSLDG